jgi:hypothetical protein
VSTRYCSNELTEKFAKNIPKIQIISLKIKGRRELELVLITTLIIVS